MPNGNVNIYLLVKNHLPNEGESYFLIYDLKYIY
jgi:hypothetical protein